MAVVETLPDVPQQSSLTCLLSDCLDRLQEDGMPYVLSYHEPDELQSNSAQDDLNPSDESRELGEDWGPEEHGDEEEQSPSFCSSDPTDRSAELSVRSNFNLFTRPTA